MDGAILLGARVVVAGALGYAGAVKLFDREGLQDASEALGVPTKLAVATGWLLPPVELALAVLLVAGATAWLGAAGAVALLVAFTALIAGNLIRGRRPSCHCFGSGSSPISWWSVARNSGLIAVVAVVVFSGPSGAGPGLFAYAGDHLTVRGSVAAVTALAVVVVVQAALLVQLLRRVRRLETGATLAAPAMVGEAARLPAPAFTLPRLDGGEVSLHSLVELGRPVLLLFTAPTCRPCRALLPEIADWQQLHGATLTIAVCPMARRRQPRQGDAIGLSNVLLQDGDDVARADSSRGTPGAVLIDTDGRIASEVAAGAPEIRALVASAASGGTGHAVARARTIGEDAPYVVLPNLDRDDTELSEYLGKMIVVLFWSPTCGFCQDMLPAWREWEESVISDDGVPAVVIARGTAKANRAQQFRTEVLLDTDGLTHRAFGADGTPMAVIVDAEGRIASSVATGALEVMALAERVRAVTQVAARLAPPPKSHSAYRGLGVAGALRAATPPSPRATWPAARRGGTRRPLPGRFGRGGPAGDQ